MKVNMKLANTPGKRVLNVVAVVVSVLQAATAVSVTRCDGVMQTCCEQDVKERCKLFVQFSSVLEGFYTYDI